MRKYSVREFERFCRERGFNSFTYLAGNQTIDEMFTPFQINAGYKSIKTFLAPTSVCFQGEGINTLRFSDAKYVLVREDLPKDHTQFAVVCGSFRNDGGTRSFIMEATKAG